ncbi:helix-turn-helix domain-containing protein [Pedobacter nutrimenti]|uniref:helix-turn-helix domain-containing protein n=1 Tax=Pedobacter nutrimenti TaxID=1241337 RepID=UPI00292F8E3A|nr:helix-turn-helix domain-containing protein [Pedobacter nutrimenti]
MQEKLSQIGNASNPAHQLIGVFAAYSPISEELKAELDLLLKVRELKKDHYLVKQGEYCNHFYFLVKGILISTTNRNNKQLTSFIIPDRNFVTSVSGMYGYKPSDDSIFAIEDSLVVSLHAKDMLYFYQQYPEMNIIMRCIMERCFQEAHERSNMIRLGTAKEKYQYLLASIPDHIGRIPLVHQANYLDIRRETLQRVNKELDIESDQVKCVQLLAKLDAHIAKHKDFLQKTITLKKLAHILEMPAHQLNHLIRNKHNKSFIQFIHSLKIDLVKKRLETTTDWKHFTLEAIGAEAGFKSRSVFFSEFKKHTGMSPGEYARKLGELR